MLSYLHFQVKKIEILNIFLIRVGIRVRNEEYLINEIYSLCQNPLRIKHMKEMAAQLKRPKAAYETAKAIFELSMH